MLLLIVIYKLLYQKNKVLLRVMCLTLHKITINLCSIFVAKVLNKSLVIISTNM